MKKIRVMMVAAVAASLAACATMGGHPYGGAEVGASGLADAGAGASGHRG